MTEADFENMLQRYLDGTSRPGERAIIEQWSQQLGKAENLTLPPAEREQVRAAMWRQIAHLTQTEATDPPPAASDYLLQHPAASSKWRAPVVRWAAAALLVLGVAFAVVLPRPRQLATASSESASWVQQQAGKQAQLLTLADGSRVTLYPGSRLRYRAGLAGPQREVRLTGEAFFQVAKNPARPFLVYTEQLVTTVLGTSFRVQAYEGRPNKVAVEEGRVSVQLRRGADLHATPAQPAKGGVVLLPNQQVAYSTLASKSLRKQLVSNPLVLKMQTFAFENKPVADVLQALEKAYGVTILYDNRKLAGCTVTITFYQESLYEKLDVLCKALGASYSTADDAQIQFKSNGCAL